MTSAGGMHRAMDICCQDKGGFINKNGVSVLAMADGAGSKFYADKGAEIAVDRGMRFISDEFDMLYNEDNHSRICKYIIEDILYGLMVEAEKINCDYHEFGATIALAAVKDDRYILFSLGDSTVYRIEEGKKIITLRPYNYGSKDVTVLTTTGNAYKVGKIRKDKLKNIDSFIIMTDGMTELYNATDLKNIENIDELCEKVEYSIDEYKVPYYDDCGFGIIYNKKLK